MATPTIRLHDGSQAALVQPSIIARPMYQPQLDSKYNYEALNSVLEPSLQEPQPARDNARYNVANLLNNRVRADEAATRTRRRLDKEKEKERKRKERERKREKKRLRRLRKKELKRKLKREQRLREKEENKKEKKKKENKKNKNKKKDKDMIKGEEDMDLDDVDNSANVDSVTLVKETKNMVTDAERDRRRKERKRERKRQKRKDRKRKLRERERKNQLEKLRQDYLTDIDDDLDDSEVKRPDSTLSAKMFSILDQGKDVKSPKKGVLRPST